MGLLDSFPTYEKTKKKKNSAKKSSKTSGQKNRVEYRHRNSSKSSKATTKTKKQVSSAKKKAKSSASSSGRRNQVEYRHRDTDASSESSLLSKELPVAKERKENTERDTALTPKMNLPYGNPKKPTTSASSASPKGFGDFRVAQREQEKNQAKPLNLQYLSSAITGNTRKDQGTGQKNAVSTALSMPSFSAERKEDTNRNTAAKTIAGPVDVSLKTITELGHEGVKANAAGKRDKSLNLQYLSNEFVNNLLNQGTKRTSDTEKMYHPFDYEKIKEQSAMRRERAKEHREALWRNIEQGARSVQRTLNKNAYSILDSSDEIHGTNGRGPVPLSKQRELNDQARETASNFFEKDAKRNEQIAKDIEEGKISSFTSKVAQGFGQLAAESPFWALGGGLGTVAKGATKAAKVAGKIINSMASPSLPYYITSDYGDQYYQARQEGATREEANKSALLYAIPAAIAERLGGADAAATKAIGQRLGDNIVSSIIKSAASEGLEEAAQTSYGNLTRRTYKDVPLFSTNPEQDAVINPQQLAESAAVGAVLGGFSGGAIHGASNIVNRTSSRADRNDNQGTSADTTAADVGNSNIPVAPNEKRNSNHRPAGDVAPTGYTPEALNDTVSVNSIPDPAENINPRNEENNTNLNEWGVEDDGEKVARITTETQRERTKIRQVAQEAQDMFTRAWVNSGYAIDRLADTSGNQNLKYRYNNVGQSPRTIESMVIQNQSDFNGRNVGKSINDIFKPIIEKGDEYYEDFQEYLFHKHNIDRMTLEHKTNGEVKNKPVFGKSVDAENSELVVQTYDQTNPEFKELAEDIYNYNRNLMQYRVDSGLISREQADTLLERYPYYVPTYRAGGRSNTGSFRQSGRRFGVDSTIARAKGSDMDLAPLHEQMVDQTAAVVYNGRINKLLNDIYDSLPPEQKNLAVEENTGYDVDSETLDGTGVQPFRVVGNQVAFYRDGKKVTMEVDDGIAYGLRELIPKGNNIAKQFFGGINNAFKSLITTYNPIFVLTNGVRDAGDAALYSANVQGFAKKYPKAWAEIVTDSERFKIYKSLGGFGASRFDDGGNRNYKEHGAVRKYTVDMIEAANYTVEQAPRYAEFLNVLERIKRERGDRTPLTEDLREFSGDDLQKALYAAADITVNFGRGGKWGKLVNAYAVPFFNAAAQGTSRYVRNITKGVRENEGNKAAQVAVVSKNVGSLVLKAAFLGIGGRLLGELMYGDDEEYQEMNERDKSLNFIIKDPTGGDLSGGTGWIRIPVGRAVSFTNDVINRVFHTGKSMYEMATDGKDASASEVLGTLSDQWSGLTAIASETVAPSNPFGENSRIDRPFSNVFLQGTDRNDNKMWNGMPVESQEFENTPINERYNERTTATSKALGNLKIGNKTFSEITGLSPQEMDYLGDSYLGTIWDFATPALTPYAEDNPFKKKFTVDPVMQNRLSSDFYKLKQQAAYKSNNNTESAAGIVSSYYNRVAGEVGQINNQISKIQNSATLSDKEKQTRTRDLREQINGLYRDAIKNEQAYGKAAERNFAELGDKKLAQFKTDKDVFGAEYAIGHYNKDIKEKADFLERKGVSYDDFYNIYFDNVRISKENKKTASYQVERLKTESFLSNSQSLSDDNFGYVANAMGLLNDDSYRKAQNLNHTVNLSYRDFFTAKRQASYIDGEINSRGKQYPGEASDSKRALVMELDDLDGGQQVSLANALGCFSDSQVTKAQTALEEAGIDMKEYFKVYTEVNRIKNQGGTTIEQRKAISDTGLTSQQKIYLNLALSTMTEREASLASVATSLGISDNDFYVIFTNLNGFEADKDANGKSVSGSLRKKSMAYIDSMPISNEQKNFFFNTVAGYSGSPRWGNINFGKQGKGIASFSESELTVDNEGNPINQPTAETASTTSLTPVQQAIHNMMGSFVEKIHQHPETKAISAAITAANAVSSGLSHTPNTNALQQAIWAPFFARVYGDQAASPQEEQSAFTGVTEDNGRFPAEIINAAMQSQIEDGIPAAITLAQWAQESGYGAHMPANSNNPFGITAGRGWTGKTVQGNNAAGTDPATYRVYDSLADAFKDHAAVLKNGYYDIDGLDVSDVDGWIGALQGVYATDPNYGNALRQIIEDNHLSQYTEMAKQYSASSLSAASAPSTIYSPVDISKINTGYPFGAPKTGGRSGTHKGTDFSVPTGTPVTAVADGTVIKAGSNGSAYGNSVLVDMGNGYYYQFNHLSDWGVKAGDTVKAGDIICKSGNTGSNNTGAHLEIEVYQGSPDYGNQIDPVAYFGWGDAEPGTVIHSTDSGNYQSQGSGSGNGSGGSGSSSGSTSQGWGYSSSGIPYAYDGSLYRSSNYRNSRTSLAGNGGRYSFEGRSLPAYQYMGPRNDLFTGNSPAPTESKGKVVYAAPDNGVNRVVVDNGDGTYTSYRNVGEINVKRGDYADESTILAGTNPDQVEVEIIQGNFLINNNDLQAYSRQLGA